MSNVLRPYSDIITQQPFELIRLQFMHRYLVTKTPEFTHHSKQTPTKTNNTWYHISEASWMMGGFGPIGQNSTWIDLQLQYFQVCDEDWNKLTFEQQETYKVRSRFILSEPITVRDDWALPDPGLLQRLEVAVVFYWAANSFLFAATHSIIANPIFKSDECEQLWRLTI